MLMGFRKNLQTYLNLYSKMPTEYNHSNWWFEQKTYCLQSYNGEHLDTADFLV